MKKLKIKIEDWDYHCSDGCCSEYGTQIMVNDVVVSDGYCDASIALEKVLTHLGYDVEIED